MALTNWVSVAADCIASIEREQVGSPCPIVDHEVGRGPADTAEDLTIWLICRSRAEQRQFADTELSRTASALRRKLLAAGFPEPALASLAVRVTSRDEVNARGYGFMR